MATFKLIISADHEIFGNGSGDVMHCMVNPTNKLREIADKFGAKITLFTDVCEYWVFEKEQPELAKAIKNQWIDFIKSNHDVQLHLHPQWLNYSFKNNNYELDYNLWRLPSVKVDNNDFGYGVKELIFNGKQTLESVLQKENKSYKSYAFRAGGWCIQPEEEVLKTLINLDFKVDSTVAPEASYSNEKSWFNFKNSPLFPFWKVNKSILQPTNTGLTEVPIVTLKPGVFQNFFLLVDKVLKKHPQKPLNCVGRAGLGKKSKLNKLKDALTPSHKMLNFSDGTAAKEMIYIASNYMKRFENETGEIPMVMIGHPKTFGNHEAFENFLHWAASNPKIEFSLYSDLKLEN